MVFGVDIGGTTIKIGLFQEERLIDKCEIPTDKTEGGKNILGDVCKKIDEMLGCVDATRDELEGIGIGVPGPVCDDGMVLSCVNIGFNDFNIEKEMEKYMPGIPVKAGNDANVAALGEQKYGGGKGFLDVVMVTLGTGVGGGIISGGKLITGSNGAAGEIGHITVNTEEAEKCNCGKCGCLEQYASATGLVRLARKYKVEPEEITAKDIFDRAKAGDESVGKTVEEFGKYLGLALANVAAVTNPQCIVIGGGVSKAGDYLIDIVKKYYDIYAFEKCKKVAFEIAKLSNDAGIYGAAALILK